MSSEFGFWLARGFGHVWSSAGLHHIAFVGVLTAAFDRRYWRGVVVLLTGFTVAHAVVLAAVAMGSVLPVGSWSESVLWGLVLAAAATTGLERAWRRRAAAARAGSGSAINAGALRASVRDGPSSPAQFAWDGPFEAEGLRVWRYVLVVTFGLVHGLAAVEAMASSLIAAGGGVVRVLAFDLGIEAGQWVVAAAVVVAAGWIAGRRSG
ncbi:MAG: HupE/UreJ family protein [Gemmatimonadetes bacterium]|nr:HupE/UreJ family protein [Gemmatimonadota bacterium]